MTARVAILTPDPAEGDNASLWPKVLAWLQVALQVAGIEAVPTPWTAHVDDAAGLRGFDRVLPLLAWGYHFQHARWLRACATWERAKLPVSNPARVLAWNSDKRYLSELAGRGVEIPPTTFTDEVSQALVDGVFAETGAEELIVKPAVSGGAWKTQRLRRGDAVAAAAGTTMLVQPYLPTIETEGETSLLYFGGRFSHAFGCSGGDLVASDIHVLGGFDGATFVEGFAVRVNLLVFHGFGPPLSQQEARETGEKKPPRRRS